MQATIHFIAIIFKNSLHRNFRGYVTLWFCVNKALIFSIVLESVFLQKRRIKWLWNVWEHRKFQKPNRAHLLRTWVFYRFKTWCVYTFLNTEGIKTFPWVYDSRFYTKRGGCIFYEKFGSSIFCIINVVAWSWITFIIEAWKSTDSECLLYCGSRL